MMRKEATNKRCPYSVLCFHPDEDDTVSSPIPQGLAERRGNRVVVVYSETNQLDGISGRCLKVLSLAQWQNMITRLRQSCSLNKKTADMLRFLHANSCECDISGGTMEIPRNLLDHLEIANYKARLYIDEKGCYIKGIPAAEMSERYSIHRLSEWFSEEENDTGGMMWNGRIRDLISDYDTAVSCFLAVLAESHPKAIQQFYRGIQAALCIASINDDAESINAVFRFCPGISRDVYCPDTSPMLCAVRNNADYAVDALIKNGVSVEACGGTSDTMLAHVLDFFADKLIGKEMIWHLLDCQLKVDIVDLSCAYFTKEIDEFMEELILRALDIDTLHPDDLESAIAELDETLQCPEAYIELAECLPEGKSYKIRKWRELLKSCFLQAQAKNVCTVSGSPEKSDATRSALQSKLLAEAEDLICKLSPEVEYYHKARAYFIAYFTPGKKLLHTLYGDGVIASNHDGILAMRFSAGEDVEIDVINEIVNEQLCVVDPTYQKHLYFDLTILRRGVALETVLNKARERIALLKSGKVSYTMLNILKEKDLWQYRR